MARYTAKALETDIKELNEIHKDSGFFLRVVPRNGYTAVDLFRVDSSKSAGSVCVRNIECGTPRECWETASHWEP